MLCPYCESDSTVKDSASDGDAVYRCRVCKSCKKQFYTIETDCTGADEHIRRIRRDRRRECRQKVKE